MATYNLRGITDSSGNRYQFYGIPYFGVCNTASATKNKTVAINDFGSNLLTNGTRVTVLFSYGQSYDGVPTLNVSNTGACEIRTQPNINAGYGEWSSGSVVTFVYYSGVWIIDDGAHATTSVYGKTRLTSNMNNEVRDNISTALAPSALTSAISGIYYQQYMGEYDDDNYAKFVDTTTPSTWVDNAVEYTDIDVSIINSASSGNRLFKVTYGDIVCYKTMSWYHETNNEYLVVYEGQGENGYESLTIGYNIHEYTIVVMATDNIIGAYPLKIEFFCDVDAGFVSYPIFKDTIGDIETLLASI